MFPFNKVVICKGFFYTMGAIAMVLAQVALLMVGFSEVWAMLFAALTGLVVFVMCGMFVWYAVHDPDKLQSKAFQKAMEKLRRESKYGGER